MLSFISEDVNMKESGIQFDTNPDVYKSEKYRMTFNKGLENYKLGNYAQAQKDFQTAQQIEIDETILKTQAESIMDYYYDDMFMPDGTTTKAIKPEFRGEIATMLAPFSMQMVHSKFDYVLEGARQSMKVGRYDDAVKLLQSVPKTLAANEATKIKLLEANLIDKSAPINEMVPSLSKNLNLIGKKGSIYQDIFSQAGSTGKLEARSKSLEGNTTARNNWALQLARLATRARDWDMDRDLKDVISSFKSN